MSIAFQGAGEVDERRANSSSRAGDGVEVGDGGRRGCMGGELVGRSVAMRARAAVREVGVGWSMSVFWELVSDGKGERMGG